MRSTRRPTRPRDLRDTLLKQLNGRVSYCILYRIKRLAVAPSVLDLFEARQIRKLKSLRREPVRRRRRIRHNNHYRRRSRYNCLSKNLRSPSCTYISTREAASRDTSRIIIN